MNPNETTWIREEDVSPEKDVVLGRRNGLQAKEYQRIIQCWAPQFQRGNRKERALIVTRTTEHALKNGCRFLSVVDGAAERGARCYVCNTNKETMKKITRRALGMACKRLESTNDKARSAILIRPRPASEDNTEAKKAQQGYGHGVTLTDLSQSRASVGSLGSIPIPPKPTLDTTESIFSIGGLSAMNDSLSSLLGDTSLAMAFQEECEPFIETGLTEDLTEDTVTTTTKVKHVSQVSYADQSDTVSTLTENSSCRGPKALVVSIPSPSGKQLYPSTMFGASQMISRSVKEASAMNGEQFDWETLATSSVTDYSPDSPSTRLRHHSTLTDTGTSIVTNGTDISSAPIMPPPQPVYHDHVDRLQEELRAMSAMNSNLHAKLQKLTHENSGLRAQIREQKNDYLALRDRMTILEYKSDQQQKSQSI